MKYAFFYCPYFAKVTLKGNPDPKGRREEAPTLKGGERKEKRFASILCH
ncbi:MAG TPA: hypothetical protein VF610_00590 [Segetibacter sp.]